MVSQGKAKSVSRAFSAFFLAFVLTAGLLPCSAFAAASSAGGGAAEQAETEVAVSPDASEGAASEPAASSSDEALVENPAASSASDSESDSEASLAAQDEAALVAPVAGTRAIEDGIYYINSSLASGKVLDVASGSTANGARVQLYSLNQTEAQKWRFLYDEASGTYTITCLKSGKAIDAKSGKTVNGTAIQQYESNGTAAQKWLVSRNDDGTLTFHSSVDTNQVLDLTSAKSANGTKVQLYESNGTAAQKFTVSSAVHQRAVQDGTYYVASCKAVGKVLDVTSGSTANGARLQNYTSNMTAAQAFAFAYDASTGYYTITNKKSGKVVDAASGKSANGTKIQQYESNGTAAQRWVVTSSADGSITISSALDPAQVLDVTSGSTANGAKIQLYAANGTAAQQWTLVSAAVPEVAASPDLGLGDGWFALKASANSANALDITSGSTADGAKAQIYTFNNTPAQLFQLSYDNGYYRIVAGTGKVLSVESGSVVPGMAIVQTTKANSDNQLFRVVANADGTYSFVCKATGTAIDAGSAAKGAAVTSRAYSEGSASQSFKLEQCTSLLPEGLFTVVSSLNTSKVLDVASGSMEEGANVQLYDSNNTFAQKWKIALVPGKQNAYTFENTVSGKYLSVDGTNVCQKAEAGEYAQWTVSAIRNGAYELQNVATGKVLDVASGKTANGTNIQVYDANSTNAQLFKVGDTTSVKAGYYVIHSRSVDSQVVDVDSGSTVNGANIQSYKSNGTGAQKWKITANDDGTYRIANAASGKVLDVASGNAVAGGNVQQYAWNGTAAQKWTVEYVGNAGFRIVSAANSGVCLDFASAPANGVNVQLAAVGATDTQLFRFETTTYSTNKWDQLLLQYQDNSSVNQLIFVKYTGGSNATIVYYMKSNGSWVKKFSVAGHVGKNGIGKMKAGDKRTPTGTFGVTGAYDIKANPGCNISYTQVKQYHYWCSDPAWYNKLIDIRQHPHTCSGEHLINYTTSYNYGLFLDFNTNPVTYGKGAAIFVHVSKAGGPTAGCISMPESYMKTIVQTVTSGAKVCVYSA